MASREAGWRTEGRDLVRGTAAGVIFGAPLLFTMEMWWLGTALSPGRLLVFLGAMIAASAAISLFLGFRDRFSPLEAMAEGIEAVALGALVSAAILVLIGAIHPRSRPLEAIGTVLVEATAISLGVAVANARFGAEADENGARAERRQGDAGGSRTDDERAALQLRQDAKDLGATVAGALLFSLNTAPTEEIAVIAARLEPFRLLLLLAVEVGLAYLVLFASGFWGREVHEPDSLFQKPAAETLVAVGVSLGVAAVLVALIGFGAPADAPSTFVAHTVVLGLPACIGGAAGRLVL